MFSLRTWAAGFALAVSAATVAIAAEPGKPVTENIILYMTDGLRWQEVFGRAIAPAG